MTTWNGMYFHSPSSLMIELVSFMHDYVMIFLLRILIVVFLNIIYVVIFKTFTLNFFEHHTLESAWTMAPFLLLIFIVVPSLKSIYFIDRCMFCGLRVNVMAHQWYWRYFYKDLFDRFFDSYMLAPEERRGIRLLEVDNRLVVPANFPLRLLLTSSDVIHSWTVPSYGLKFDAVPGRVNQFCFTSKRSGVFFGQCSEICGINHRFMPIVMEVVPFQRFFTWWLE